MASLLWNPVDSLADGIHKIKCEDCDCFLKYKSIKDDFMKDKFVFCNKVCSNKIDEELKKKQFKNTFCNNDILILFCC